MRKSEMLRQNLSLFEQLQKVRLENKALGQELSECRETVAALKKTIAELRERQDTTVPFRRLESKVETKAVLPDEVEYGASVIGKIVISAADYSNRLTAGGETRYKELVNLILGRTEIAKSEIMSLVSADRPLDEKKSMIDARYEAAIEYFNNIMAQRV